MVEVYETEGGVIYAIVKKLTRHNNGVKTYDVANVLTGFEDCLLTGENFIEVAKEDFPYCDEYEPRMYDGWNMCDIAAYIAEDSALIAIFDNDGYKLFPSSMGFAGMNLFEIQEEEEEE